MTAPVRDLIILAADKNIDYGLRGLLSRPAALGTQAIDADILVHPRRDPGCLREAHDFLRPFQRDFRRALVVFDREGSGREGHSGDALEQEVRTRLSASGWDDRAEVIVPDPELEVWVFANSPHVERCLKWPYGRGTIRRWLERQNRWEEGRPKPDAPKEALERALREIRQPRSSALYECLGRRVSVRGCEDRAFNKLTTTLAGWFPAGETA